jgi:hypothetical protein
MERRFLPEHRLDVFGAHRRDGSGVEGSESFPQRRRTTERPLHRYLLIEQHPDEQRERVGDEELVGFGVAGDGQHCSCHAAQPTEVRGSVQVPHFPHSPSVV